MSKTDMLPEDVHAEKPIHSFISQMSGESKIYEKTYAERTIVTYV